MENPSPKKATTAEASSPKVEAAVATTTENIMATTKNETVHTTAENVVKSVSNMWREQYERVLDESKKSMDKSFTEAHRMAQEGAHLWELQMQASKDLSHAWLENARRVTSMFS